MKNIRIIPRLDIKGTNLVKGIHMEGLRVLGSPERFAEYYYKAGADELVYMDVVASLYGRNSLTEIIKKTAEKIFIPLAVGGGLRTLNDIKTVLRAGADKVALNTMAIKNPGLIKEAAKKFGSSTIIISIEAIKQLDGRYMAFSENARESTGLEVLSWAKKVEELGAGEILLTAVDREGTGLGYDIELTKAVSESVSIPVIANGGAGKIEDIKDVIKGGKADAVCLASVLHYDFVKNHLERINLFSDKTEGNVEFLKKGKISEKIKTAGLPEIKSYLLKQGIFCRN
jgi:imidazole glycerol-phosphate synthase subunit HisF